MSSVHVVVLDCRAVRRRCKELGITIASIPGIHYHLAEAIQHNEALRLPRDLLLGIRVRLKHPLSEFLLAEEPSLHELNRKLDEIQGLCQAIARRTRANSTFGSE